ncbi:hypothetical protein [Leifsonia sp. NPDC080035]|uniref:Integral membrane protein n=1 Tax=Leifsonia sp. NPDC080035 TaxID=3143936 RepID=A0AAU7GD82_9MICO
MSEKPPSGGPGAPDDGAEVAGSRDATAADPGPLGPAAAAGAPAAPLSRGAVYGSVGAVWVIALVLGVLIGTLSHPAQYASWLSLALGVCVIASFGAQLATQQKDGFVNRLAATLTGTLVILGVIGAILGLTTLGH